MIFEVPFHADTRFRMWAKVVSRVDINKKNGYAFEGHWIKPGLKADEPVGSVIIVYGETGSRKWHSADVRVYILAETGPVEVLFASGKDWALQIRDKVAEILEKDPLTWLKVNKLGSYELSIEEVGALKLARVGEKLVSLNEIPLDQLGQEDKDRLAIILAEQVSVLHELAQTYQDLIKLLTSERRNDNAESD